MNKRLLAETNYWIFVAIFLAAWMPFRFETPISNVRHTYELPSTACSNRLTSDYWGWEYFREGLFVVFLLIPYSGLFMLWSKNTHGIIFHLVILAMLMCWGVINVAYDIDDMTRAQLGPTDEHFNEANLARSTQWCLIYGGQPGTELICANIGPCNATIPVTTADLHVNGPYRMRFCFLIFLMVMMAFDLGFTLSVWWPLVMPPSKTKTAAPVATRYNILKRG
jgi:hypothetical protein